MSAAVPNTLANSLVQIRDVSKVYTRGKQKVEVLHNLNLEVQKGEFISLMLRGIDSPQSGAADRKRKPQGRPTRQKI